MQEKFAMIHRKAVCIGCPFSSDVAGTLVCQKFRNGGIMMNCEEVTPDMCSDLAESDCAHMGLLIVNQLKLTQVKLGMGFLIEPVEDDLGEAEVRLIGPTGVVHECKLSELFPEETFAVLPALRIFNHDGEDVTLTAMKAFLQKTYEKAPLAVSSPFASLLEDADGDTQ